MQKFRALKGKGLAFLLFIWFLWFVNFSGRTLFSPILPLMEDEFGVTHARAASIFTFITFGYALGLFCAGMVSGRLGSKRTILAALFVETCMFGLISTVATFNLLYVATFILSFALGLHLPTIIPMITEYYEERVWGKVIAIQESATSLSIFAVPFLALGILSFLPYGKSRGPCRGRLDVASETAYIQIGRCENENSPGAIRIGPRGELRGGPGRPRRPPGSLLRLPWVLFVSGLLLSPLLWVLRVLRRILRPALLSRLSRGAWISEVGGRLGLLEEALEPLSPGGVLQFP